MASTLTHLTLSLMAMDDEVMLVYLGRGERTYGQTPLPIFQRGAWEFQAVVEGEIAPVVPNGIEPPSGHKLWVFPPNLPHGWTGSEVPAKVVVFHFRHVPATVQDCLPAKGWLAIPLMPPMCQRLQELAARAASHLAQPASDSHLSHEHCLLELSLMITSGHREAEPETHGVRGHRTVDRAIQWYGEHLNTGPSLNEVSKSIGVSPAHLRRLFQRFLGSSPKEVLSRLQIQRAIDLMADPSLPLERIADICGFSEPSSFSRAFRRRYGMSAQEWRQKVLP